MPYHHLAVATHDIVAIDTFYTRAMGFERVHVEVARSPEGGWAKHFFYDCGGGEMMAFWELHDDALPEAFPTSLSGAAGLPSWTNHVAWKADSPEDIDRRRDRWLEHGYDVVEIDHRWCTSIYTTDPNGTLVEFCLTTAPFAPGAAEKARRALTEDDLEFDPQPDVVVHKASVAPLHERTTRP